MNTVPRLDLVLIAVVCAVTWLARPPAASSTAVADAPVQYAAQEARPDRGGVQQPRAEPDEFEPEVEVEFEPEDEVEFEAEDGTERGPPAVARSALGDKAQCMRGGWSGLDFRNQGQCIRWVQTGFDSRSSS